MTALIRTERRERLKAELIAAAGQVFLRNGFHHASLEEIAKEAGYTQGAVYSAFRSKDELLLAVFDNYYEQQLRALATLLRDASTLKDGLRITGQQMSDQRDPGWIPLLVESWTHALRRPQLRQELLKRRQHQMDSLGVMLTEIAASHGIEFAVPPINVARTAVSLAHGIALEQLLDPDANVGEMFEDMFVSVILGLAQPQ